MAFRTEEVKSYKTMAICDDCKKETMIAETPQPLGFENKMNGALASGYTFKDTGKQFVNYCKTCKSKHQ
jgi:hypothetical protein